MIFVRRADSDSWEIFTIGGTLRSYGPFNTNKTPLALGLHISSASRNERVLVALCKVEDDSGVCWADGMRQSIHREQTKLLPFHQVRYCPNLCNTKGSNVMLLYILDWTWEDVHVRWSDNSKHWSGPTRITHEQKTFYFTNRTPVLWINQYKRGYQHDTNWKRVLGRVYRKINQSDTIIRTQIYTDT